MRDGTTGGARRTDAGAEAGLVTEGGDATRAPGAREPARRTRAPGGPSWAPRGGGLEPAVAAYLREIARQEQSSRMARRSG